VDDRVHTRAGALDGGEVADIGDDQLLITTRLDERAVAHKAERVPLREMLAQGLTDASGRAGD
jgi:hypothetical protein